jgi:enterochelin esterase-like enzyme
LPNPLDYRIYLPPCYAEALDQHYPVLYLVHGQSFTDDQWDRLGVDETMDKMVASGEISPFIIVMPRDTNWGTAEQDPFDEAVLQGLIPYIDTHYSTLDDRTHRAIGGLSRGAGWAANLGLKYPDLFGSVGLHSLAIFWSDVTYVKKWLDEIPPEAMPRFYIDAGLNDRPEILESSRWFENLLTQRNIAHEWHLFAGYHDEIYWKLHLEQYLRWYAAEW